MLLKVKGKALSIVDTIVGKVTKDPNKINLEYILITNNPSEFNNKGFKCILTELKIENQNLSNSIIHSISTLEYLKEDDIVAVNTNGVINTLYRVNSLQNSILATERCNSNCLMCSQPPKDRDDVEYLFNVYKQMIPLVPKDCLELGISGGEPTLIGDYFFELIELMNEHLPETEIHILSNGRTFAWNNLAERLSKLDTSRIMIGIPIYSDFYQIHDYIVQAENAFYQTILGIHNLSRYNIRVEIRIVLHKQTIGRLEQLSNYIYKNLPFVSHVAFMALEYVGYTPHNIDKLWVDPYDYQDTLQKSVTFLAEKGITTSIYNTPLCLVPENVREYNRKAISDWKNEYLDECKVCSKLDECGGFFRWNLKKHSEHIKPFQEIEIKNNSYEIL
ncbi:His-Xaa-Ser system radical SAM maturase HxsC [Empedobacter falsenii]